MIKFTLKSKLLFLSAVTVLFMSVLAGAILYDIFQSRNNLRQTKLQIVQTHALSRVIHYMQIERGLIAGLIASHNLNSKDDRLISAMNNLDAAIDDAKNTFSYTKSVSSPIIDLLNNVKLNRKTIFLLKMSVSDAKSYYTKNIAELLYFTKSIPTKMYDNRIRNTVDAYVNLSWAKESLGQIRATLNEVFIKKEFTDTLLFSFAGSLQAYNANTLGFKALSPEETLDFYDNTFKGSAVEDTFTMIRNVKEHKNLSREAAEWFEKSTQSINLLKSVEDELIKVINKKIDDKLEFAFYKIVIISSFLAVSIFTLVFLMILAIKRIISTTNTLEQEQSNALLLLEQYKAAVDRSFIVTKTDSRGIITYVNDEFCKISGYTREELIGKPHNIIRHQDTPKETFKELWHTIKKLKQPWSGEIQNRRKNGTSYWIKAVISPIMDKHGTVVEYIGVRTNITEIKDAAMIDFLTGYGNRTKLNSDIEKLQKIYIAVLNLDNFREINDFYGHKFGNDTIKTLSDKIYALISKDDSLRFYRLQGDEFVILASSSSKYLFESMIEDVLSKIKEGFMVNGEHIFVTCSCGISYEEDKEKLLSTANMALKKAKKSNAGFVVYDEDISLNEEYKNNITWSKKLTSALKQDNITLYYQPIVNNSDMAYQKYECLVRMLEGDKIISPFFFLDIAKKTRQYFDITKIVIMHSFEKFKDSDKEFSINLSINDILERQIFDYILIMLSRYNIGDRVVFEIVESEYIEKFEDVMKFITEVRKFGCKIAIDDFGTGYSNFEYLVKIKADYLKIDGSLIKNIDKDNNAYLVVSTIVEFARKLGIKTVAEFVENEKIFNITKELGIDYSQGYYFSEPLKDVA